MTRIKIYTILFIALCFSLKAQQDPMYSMYMFDDAIINPAYAGSSAYAVGTLKHRTQFVGITGHPVTQTLNFHSPIQSKNIGLGGKIINDKIGFQKSLVATAYFSYHLNFAGGKLSLGLEGGVFNRKINYDELVLTNKNDPTYAPNMGTSNVPELNAGIYYQKKEFYFGVSQYHLIKASTASNLDYKTKLRPHIYITSGKIFEVSKLISIEPNMLIKIQPKNAVQLDLNMIVYYNERFAAGLQYRTQDAICLILKAKITDNLKIAYSYDATISKLSKQSNGAHEILLSYGIKLPPPPARKETHPRFYF